MAEDNTNSSLSSETPGKNESDGGRPIKSSTVKARHLSNWDGVLPSDSLPFRGSSDDGGSSRRKSTGKQNSPDSGQSILPHYLRASTGSCHDFCKYGRKHSFEPKPMHPLSQRIKKPPNPKLKSAGATVGEGMKVAVVKQRPSDHAHDLEAHFPAPPEIIKDVVFLQPKEVEPAPRQDSSSDKMMPKMEKKIKNLSAKCSPPMQCPQAKVMKQSSFSKTLEGVKPDARRNSDIMGCERDCDSKTGRKIMASRASRQSLMEPLTASSTSKSSVSEALNLRKRMNFSSTLVKNVKNQNRMGEADTKTEENVYEKTLHVIQMEGKDDLVEPAQDGEILASLSPPSLLLPESSSAYSYIESNPSKTLTKAKPVVSKLETPSPVKLKFRRGKVVDIRNENNGPRRLSFRKGRVLGKNQENKMEGKDKLVESTHGDHTISSPPPSCEKGGGQDGKEGSGVANSDGDGKKIALNSKGAKSVRKGRVLGKNQENKMEGKDKLVESTHGDHMISSPPPSCKKGGGQDGKEGSGVANSDGDGKKIALNSKGAKSVGRHQNKTLKKDNLIVTRVNNPLSVKLKFRRGTVVNLEHENNGPRRLGFRKGRYLRENQDSRNDVKKKNSTKRVEGVENSTGLNTGKVVLRHQDVQGKKDARGLFNNVIEETASKLVKSKKSKVKALVGAFETVISLQEKRPSARSAS